MRLALPLGALLLMAGACSRPEGMWRDQYVFVADDGTVVPVGVLRWSTGRAEAKGWLGEDGTWRTNFYRHFPISQAGGPDASRALSLLSRTPGAPARINLDRDGAEAELRLRTPSELLLLSAHELAPLGETVDPEGTSVYRGGRARLRNGASRKDGWLLVEETPPDRPRASFVDYGDFVFVVVAHPERGLLVAKHSADRPDFDHAFLQGDDSHDRSRDVQITRDGSALEVAIPEFSLSARLEIRDQDRTVGTAPGGSAVTYETLLLGGDFAGVAFTIRSGHVPTLQLPTQRENPR